ncbi:MAG: tetraacyldisaccharide 4'-kinase [Legionellales bacterium]|nr:tetraacyldisaccharide 4'-kinase [Legionellales bacterium]|tara:strand:+ start:7721 stop:7903 length:183 start_codon:yes stop_codon:yes gene_type:complete
MDKKLFEILACPLCKGKLDHDKSRDELICRVDRFAFPIREGIPVMLVDEARQLELDEYCR